MVHSLSALKCSYTQDASRWNNSVWAFHIIGYIISINFYKEKFVRDVIGIFWYTNISIINEKNVKIEYSS